MTDNTAENFMLFFQSNTDVEKCLAAFDKLSLIEQRRLHKCFEVVKYTRG